MPDTPPLRESAGLARWRRFSAEAVRVFHLYANWLVGITWKRFAVLSLLLLIVMAMLSNVPPFKWTVTDVLDTPAARSAPRPKASLPAPPEPPSTNKVPDVKIDKSGVRIEAPNGGGDDNVVISINKDGVHITPHIRAASGTSAAASAASAASSANTAPLSASAAGDGASINIKLPPGADVEAIKDAVREGLAQAREAAAEAANDAREAAAEAAAEAADAKTSRDRKSVV